ncbi:FAD-binding oxidoreductase [Streptomyces sp. SID13666]|uniref:FAD-binding oxidoreductase n=1 Tax=unclassified Streptomyces TaxID=2593676 RepID=UPI0013C140D0|nr:MULTISPECIES: FAD-binding oxidoreductase [unclassified Streptomyces]NEA55077.1 FAD-binding oxidoreductase [Streptomyces sp. SID13666]NEA71084.1 FAD-binding oxidoreductase [Streptomyces sp. SID13588]
MNDAAAAASLRDRVRGEVLLPGDDRFDARCAGFQTAYRHRPSVLVRAADPEDVVSAVAYAAAHDLPVAVQATGHGLSVATDGGMLISTAALTGVTIDARARTARIGAGTRFAAIVDAAARYGLAPLNGSSPGVGTVGYILGGGLGLLAREFGYAADRVTSIDIVTADARLRRITADSDPELFWALRGAGANFGVITGMEIDLVPVSRLYGGELVFDLARTPALLAGYLSWTETLPEELTSSVSLLDYPDMPLFPATLRGRYAAHVRIAYTGDSRTGEQLVAPLRALGPRLTDTVAEIPYTECGAIYNDPPMPHAYQGDNVLLRAFGPEQAAEVTELVGPGSAVPCVVDIRHLGGALGRAAEVPNAVGHREARYLLRVLMPLMGAGQDEVFGAQNKVLGALAAESVGGRFQSLVYGGCADGAPGEPAEDFWEPADHRRLAALKFALDPANLFRFNRNIRPVG